jgi:hypothetical protein
MVPKSSPLAASPRRRFAACRAASRRSGHPATTTACSRCEGGALPERRCEREPPFGARHFMSHLLDSYSRYNGYSVAG